MDKSIFEVLGPVMIGPSSSHTAGAARIANIAAHIAGKGFNRVVFGLHGSFYETGRGHGTHKALAAGVLGFGPSDERIRDAFHYVELAGLQVEFRHVQLENVHENTVCIEFYRDGQKLCEVTGSSIGGGNVEITRIDSFDVKISGSNPTLLIRQNDKKGVVSDIAAVLADNDINIGTMTLSRTARGGVATTIIETDSVIGEGVAESLMGLENVLSVRILDAEGADSDV